MAKRWEIRSLASGKGHWGHKGIPGHRGGSLPGKGGGASGGASGGGGRPSLKEDNGKALTAHIKEKMAEAGLPRTSQYGGGEIRGITNSVGSTGFSVRDLGKEGLDFHVVVSGKEAGLKYRNKYDRRAEANLHYPVDPNSLNPKVQKVFEGMGFKVKSVVASGWQEMWDDDVEYNIKTDRVD